ncbi:hypothetical protein KSP40_PGU016234 [Platanthera guangdongensis]|uniref:Uncharacterized protein n=1 Tax=Platanthera guangdongensis TaxID=2320717 RepID=A0ABR2LFY3_9ASPA
MFPPLKVRSLPSSIKSGCKFPVESELPSSVFAHRHPVVIFVSFRTSPLISKIPKTSLDFFFLAATRPRHFSATFKLHRHHHIGISPFSIKLLLPVCWSALINRVLFENFGTYFEKNFAPRKKGQQTPSDRAENPSTFPLPLHSRTILQAAAKNTVDPESGRRKFPNQDASMVSSYEYDDGSYDSRYPSSAASQPGGDHGYDPNFVPDSVKTFVGHLYRHIREKNVYEINHMYEGSFQLLSERMFRETPWPSVEAVAQYVDKDHVFCLLYRELWFRHVYARLSPTGQQRVESWDNYCSLFGVVLHGVVNMQLPNQWLWDMVDEFVYQFQSQCQYRAKLKSKTEEELQLLKQFDQQKLWPIMQTMVNAVLHLRYMKHGHAPLRALEILPDDPARADFRSIERAGQLPVYSGSPVGVELQRGVLGPKNLGQIDFCSSIFTLSLRALVKRHNSDTLLLSANQRQTENKESVISQHSDLLTRTSDPERSLYLNQSDILKKILRCPQYGTYKDLQPMQHIGNPTEGLFGHHLDAQEI